jgi:hypothetical protein
MSSLTNNKLWQGQPEGFSPFDTIESFFRSLKVKWKWKEFVEENYLQ